MNSPPAPTPDLTPPLTMTTFNDLFRFYDEYVKLLYSSVQAENNLPLETLFEINAALDHISRHWASGESEEKVVEKAYSHLKRSCLDIFKIKLKETGEEYDKLLLIDTSILDNGAFDKQMHEEWDQIKRDSTVARAVEGKTDDAFEKWVSLYEKCLNFHMHFYMHKGIEWAKRKQNKNTRQLRVEGFVLGVISSLVAALIWLGIGYWFSKKD